MGSNPIIGISENAFYEGEIRGHCEFNRFWMFAHQNARITRLFSKFCQVEFE